MKTLYKLEFISPVHFGTSAGLLTDSQATLHADTLFSALLQEALALGGQDLLQSLYQAAREDRLRISDALPYLEEDTTEHYLIPVPLLSQAPFFEDSSLRKAHKKIAFIPASQLQTYTDMTADPANEATIRQWAHLEKSLGQADLRASVNLQSPEDARPYALSTWTFSPKAGLYILLDADAEDIHDTFTRLLESLSYTGLGGKRRVGLGQFTLEDPLLLPEDYCPDLAALSREVQAPEGKTAYMTLSACLPTEEELSQAMEGATFKLLRRGGFTDSTAYAPTWVRKKDLYLCQTGSVFQTSFSGDVYDVAMTGNHPIYRYGKPYFMEVPQ